MTEHPLDLALFQGHASLEDGQGWVKPWRLSHNRKALFPSPDEGLLGRAECTSGVRLRFATDATQLRLTTLPLPDTEPGGGREAFMFDLTQDGDILASTPVPPTGSRADFAGLPPGEKTVELWLPPEVPVSLSRLETNDGAQVNPVADERPRWITYGSSLTHCVRAHSPARIWPAIVARRRGLHLTNLGFGGQCHVDAQVGMLIAEQPADLITLKLGINCIGAGTLSSRTYPAAVLSLVRVIRVGHPDVPIGLISPIGYPPHETKPNVVGYTIGHMREAIVDVHRRLTELGEENLYCFNGLDVFDLDLIGRYAEDQCHPNGDGIEIMGDNFDRVVMARMLEGLGK